MLPPYNGIMPKLTDTSIAIRVNQALEVLGILIADKKTTLDKACKQVGIEPRQYRFWIRRSHEAIEVFHEAMRELERAELSNILIAREAIQQKLIDDGLSKFTDPNSRLSILEYFDTRADELLNRHANSNVGDMRAVLSGPKLAPGSNRLSSGGEAELEVLEGSDGEVIVRQKKPVVIEGEFSNTP